MAVATASPAPPRLFPPEPDLLNTLPDPRTPSSASSISRNDSVADSSQPDYIEEIAKLSEKLVNAINHQTNLDDILQHTRHELELTRREHELSRKEFELARNELELARQEIARLQAEAKEHADQIESGALVPKDKVDQIAAKFKANMDQTEAKCKANIDQIEAKCKADIGQIEAKCKADISQIEAKCKTDIAAEQELRVKADKAKKAMEQELECLTSDLFQEANTMVADARKEKEASDRKNDQLKNQLKDTEVLLQSQQEQLQDLKAVLEKMTSEQGDGESLTHASSNTPSSPAGPNDRMSKVFESAHFPASVGEEVLPDHPLHFSDILQPVLRIDVQAFEDFSALIKQAKAASPPPSRIASGSYGSMNVSNYAANSAQLSPTPSLTIPNRPLREGSTSPKGPVSGPILPTMRETKVFKRTLVEDIEPTLRLDIAPGVSWMVRRAVLNSMIDGSLVVEPMPPPPVKFRGPVNPCSLCGENRAGDTYARKHRFRISEDREKRPFPLCDLCLGRLRSCGDILSFLRMVSNGHWKADGDDEIKAAWEEFVRLKERMFWHRLAGGVIPVGPTQAGVQTEPAAEAAEVAEADEEKTSEAAAPEDPFHVQGELVGEPATEAHTDMTAEIGTQT
jgi:Rab guanine nucleotide exchange factor SEC2